MWPHAGSLKRLGQVPFKGRSPPSLRAMSDSTWNTGARAANREGLTSMTSQDTPVGEQLSFDVSIAHSPGFMTTGSADTPSKHTNTESSTRHLLFSLLLPTIVVGR